MTDDYSAPLGLDREQAPRRRLPLWPFLLAPSLALVAGMAAWAVLNPDPHGGQPRVVLDLPPAAPPAAEPAPAPDAEPDDPDGEIIIRDP